MSDTNEVNVKFEFDAVEHPKHYNSHPSGIECIEITEHHNFCIGNAIKYLWRVDDKNGGVEDLEKALWYIKREIARRCDSLNAEHQAFIDEETHPVREDEPVNTEEAPQEELKPPRREFSYRKKNWNSPPTLSPKGAT